MGRISRLRPIYIINKSVGVFIYLYFSLILFLPSLLALFASLLFCLDIFDINMPKIFIYFFALKVVVGQMHLVAMSQLNSLQCLDDQFYVQFIKKINSKPVIVL